MIRILSAAALLFAACPAAAQSAAARPTAGQPPAASPIRRMAHISVEVVGRGSPVILIPGLSIGREGWRATADRLKDRHRVYLVEVNGFGGSDAGANADGGVLDGLVADLHQLIGGDKLERPAVVGHSLGGLAATMLAARHPGDVGRLMVVDALPFIGTILAPGSSAATIAPMAAAMRDRTAATPRNPTPITADPGGIWSNTPAGRIQVAEWSRSADPRVTAQALYDDMTTDVTPDLAKVTARPFTVLYATGAGPMVVPVWENAYRGSPATLEPVADSYHFIMLDQPTAFSAALDRFLAR